MRGLGGCAIELLLAYYADDFTGSTDALEALSLGGAECALFVEPPSVELMRRYPHVRAIGIAGNSRAMSRAEMDSTLPSVFEALGALEPRVVHYKVCSTFDSSPEVGSIGRAIEIGQDTFGNPLVPVVVGVPHLQRFCVFGNLFARSGLDSEPFRLDRHPTMRRHPVTPMAEADLRVHLSQQTSRQTGLVNVLAMERGFETARTELDKLTAGGAQAVLFDILTDGHLATAGQLICDLQARETKPLFAVGSSGVEYGLTKYWRSAGTLPHHQIVDQPRIEPAERVVVVSGSCSPVSRRQIAWAVQNGFDEVRFDVCPSNQDTHVDDKVAEAKRKMIASLDAGRSVILHTYRSLNENALDNDAKEDSPRYSNGRSIGDILGEVLCDTIHARSVSRLAVVGGDTSGVVARAIGIEALEMLAPLEPGAPLCTARSQDPAVEGLEVVFKGGQVGYDDFFGSLRSGQSTRSLVGAV